MEYVEDKGELPQVLTFSLAALLVFYRGKREAGLGLNDSFVVQDDEDILDLFQELWADYDKTGDLRMD